MNAILTILPLLITVLILFDFIVLFKRRTARVERFYHTFYNTNPSCLPIGHRQISHLSDFTVPPGDDMLH
jgi:hypothetical protein